jgi:hypothetical protein
MEHPLSFSPLGQLDLLFAKVPGMLVNLRMKHSGKPNSISIRDSIQAF